MTDITSRKNKKFVYILSGAAVVMLCAAFASKPLYDTFCRVTGYGGTTRAADENTNTPIDKTIKVRFDANTMSGLPWEFKPEQTEIDVQIGGTSLAFYTAKNYSTKPVVGTATYNVTPAKAGPYFTKLECFCFTEQVIAPGKEASFPVIFYIDPKIAEDKNMEGVETITLSYSFFRDKDQSAAQSRAALD